MRRRRDFRIRACRRTYDRVAGKFSFDISYETHTKITPRSLVVAEAFGLGIDEAQKFKVLDAQLKIGPQDIVYITGDSGSGKSVLLRAIRADLGEEAIDLSEVSVDPDKPLIETVGATVEQGLELLSKVGLNDAFLFLRTYNQLSDGQKYRYRIAKLIESRKQWWLMDEFAAEDVLLTGYVTDEELAWLYRNCFAFLYPSLFEGFGMPVLEALTLGAPVICSNNTALPEVAGDAALLVDPLDVSAIAAAMRRLASGEVSREALKQKGEIQSRRFSWQESGRKLHELYERVRAR